MWIFSKYGFFSVTQHAKRRDNIQVRARTEQDLQDLKAAFPPLDRSPIIETPDADYRWRLIVQRWKWEIVGAHLVADIDYHNYKGKMATMPTQRDKLPMLHDIWDLHHRYQERKQRPDPYAGHPELFRPHGDHLFDEDSMNGGPVERPDEDDIESAWSAFEQDEQDREDERKGRAKESDPEDEPDWLADPWVKQAELAAQNTLERNAEREAERAKDMLKQARNSRRPANGNQAATPGNKRGNGRKGKGGGA